MNTDLLDREDVDERRKESARIAEINFIEEVNDLKWLMKSRRGRRIIWSQLERAAVFRSSFNTEPLIMAKAEGFKEYGYYLLQMIHLYCPENYATMVEESRERKLRNSRNTRKSGSSATI